MTRCKNLNCLPRVCDTAVINATADNKVEDISLVEFGPRPITVLKMPDTYSAKFVVPISRVFSAYLSPV